jgi:GntR family transcriptional regulator, transcriptional repressor for pyruvate dehydrogenase complex
MKITRVRQQTVVEQVMNQIKELIASGHYKPHDRIPTEAELAGMFGVGRSSIREAIKIFQHLGILESRTKTGTYVCNASHVSREALTWCILLAKGDLFEIVDLREIIERQALSDLTRLVGKKQKEAVRVAAELQAQIGIMAEAALSLQLETLITADYDFHGAIIASSGNSLYVSIYATLRSFMLEEIKKTNARESERSAMLREHRAIAAAVFSGKGSAALGAFARHIETTRKQLRRSLGARDGRRQGAAPAVAAGGMSRGKQK